MKKKKAEWKLSENDTTKLLERSYVDLKIQVRVAQINDLKTYMLFNEKGNPFYDNQNLETIAFHLDIRRLIEIDYFDKPIK